MSNIANNSYIYNKSKLKSRKSVKEKNTKKFVVSMNDVLKICCATFKNTRFRRPSNYIFLVSPFSSQNSFSFMFFSTTPICCLHFLVICMPMPCSHLDHRVIKWQRFFGLNVSMGVL